MTNNPEVLWDFYDQARSKLGWFVLLATLAVPVFLMARADGDVKADRLQPLSTNSIVVEPSVEQTVGRGTVSGRITGGEYRSRRDLKPAGEIAPAGPSFERTPSPTVPLRRSRGTGRARLVNPVTSTSELATTVTVRSESVDTGAMSTRDPAANEKPPIATGRTAPTTRPFLESPTTAKRTTTTSRRRVTVRRSLATTAPPKDVGTPID